MKVTQWFRWNAKPARIGYYQRNYGPSNAMLTAAPDYWNGESWILCSMNGQEIGPVKSNRSWRGVAK